MAIFDERVLATLADGSRRKEFRSAEPSRHVVIDGLFDDAALREVVRDFPAPDAPFWRRTNEARAEIKLATRRAVGIPESAMRLIQALHSPRFVEALAAATGVNGLIVDPHLDGGGLHQIERGGRLAIHRDFMDHPIMHVNRRLNVIVYLNEGWREEWGGALEIWDRDLRRCERRIAPLFNRTLVFLTTDYSYHGHPDPLDCPPGVTRKSVALYYYTNGRPDDEVSLENRSRGGRYVRRPGDRWTPTDLARVFTPPLLYDAARWLYLWLKRRRR